MTTNPHPKSPPHPEDQPLAVLVDFDGTITTRDIGDQVVINFADPGWEGALDRYRAGAAFAGWRVNYDDVLLQMASLTMAPYAPWSSDRSAVRRPASITGNG